MISLAKRIARRYLPNVDIASDRGLETRLPAVVLGLAWLHPDGTPFIVYSHRLPPRQKALTILHELAHHVFGDVFERRIGTGVQWREDRADRFAEHMLALLEISAPSRHKRTPPLVQSLDDRDVKVRRGIPANRGAQGEDPKVGQHARGSRQARGGVAS
jgi:hypothetical protein